MASSIMNEAFVREDFGDDGDDLPEGAAPSPSGSKNYITSADCGRLRTGLMYLIDTERPEVVGIVSWVASNGDHSENDDYLYDKRRPREIGRHIRFLTRRTEKTEVIDASLQDGDDQIFFGTTVTCANQRGGEKTIIIVDMNEVDPDIGHVSWISSIAHTLIKARVGDMVLLRTPTGVERIDVPEVKYPPRTA